MWVFNVVVYRFVISEHFPVRWNRNFVPSVNVVAHFEEIERTQRRLAYKVELPCAVEALVAAVHRLCPWSSIVFSVGKHLLGIVVRHICCNGTFFVLGEHSLVFPVW